ncbi:hypothetical protein ACF0H5_009111 [Mactra antiquata]
MVRRRTSSISGRTRLLVLSAVLVVTVCCLVFITNTNVWAKFNGWIHIRQDHNEYQNDKEIKAPTASVPGLLRDYLDDTELTEETTESVDATEETVAENNMNHTECGEGKIYFSNDLYDCDGLMKDRNLDSKVKEQKAKEPKGAEDKKDKKDDKSELVNSMEKTENKTLGGEDVKHILLHCGGNMPTAVDIFLDAYPKAELYHIYSFIPDKSYSILYSKYKKHTTIIGKVSDKTVSKHEDIKTYGSSYESTQTIEYIDIATWISDHIKPSDEVIMILESDKEQDIVKHLVNTNVIGHIDKYYSSQHGNNSNHIEHINQILKTQKLVINIWNNDAKDFSDYNQLNAKHIPTPGMTITNCSQSDDHQKFLLILYSPEASVNSLQVINFLQTFAHSDHLQTWIFLPYKMFKLSSDAELDREALFHVFNVGMYIQSGDDSPSSVRNKATFVNRMFEKQEAALEYILFENNTDRSVLKYLQDEENYKCLIGGVDITHLTTKVKKYGTVDIDDTGKQPGDILLINIDKTDSEYLVLFFIRHFIPWLMSVKECTV